MVESYQVFGLKKIFISLLGPVGYGWFFGFLWKPLGMWRLKSLCVVHVELTVGLMLLFL